jgi:lipopolysaccharide export system permease protein
MLKKLYAYQLKRFFTTFVMTFLICLLIVEMQFLWKHVAELVGKGIGVSVLAEFFIYSSTTLVPMALPLAILLAALMTFGNLGENFELTAMKAAGVSLFRIMRPLIFLIACTSVGAFFFSNNVLPIAQKKLWTLIWSLKAKSPELEIPQGEFYNGINGYHIYVQKKDGAWLQGMMIYDFSQGFQNASITVADTGKIAFTADKKYLLLTLLHGESFENVKGQRISYSSSSIPYRREEFKRKELLMNFNSEFTRYDESSGQHLHVSKNLVQLTHDIDSLAKMVDAENSMHAAEMVGRNYLGRERLPDFKIKTDKKENLKAYNTDAIFSKMSYSDKQRVAIETMKNFRIKKDATEYNRITTASSMLDMRRHQMEWHHRFTLAFACLIFFFIGAPLGAIIRKGGLGMPVVVSVVMFVVYYIIDTFGGKMAREGLWEVWQGIWLSSAVLLPIGIFLTYKAAKDSELFRNEAYLKFFNKTIQSVKLLHHSTFKKNKKLC